MSEETATIKVSIDRTKKAVFQAFPFLFGCMLFLGLQVYLPAIVFGCAAAGVGIGSYIDQN